MCNLSGCVVLAPCHRNGFERICLVPVIVPTAVLVSLSQSPVNLLWERQITSHDGFTVCGDEKQNLFSVVDKAGHGIVLIAPSASPRRVQHHSGVAMVHVSLEAPIQHPSLWQRAGFTLQKYVCCLSLPWQALALSLPRLWRSLLQGLLCEWSWFFECIMKDLVYLHGACSLVQLLSTVQWIEVAFHSLTIKILSVVLVPV